MNGATSRRQCLRLLGGLVASCLMPAGHIDVTDSGDAQRVRAVLISLLPDRIRLHAIVSAGAPALTTQHIPAALRAIFGGKSLREATRMTAEALKRMLVERIQVDFTDNRTACVDGWILSITEAHLYALAGLRGTS